MALHLPSSTRLSSALHVSSKRHPLVINHIAVCIPWVLLVTGLEGKGGVDEIEIDEVELAVS